MNGVCKYENGCILEEMGNHALDGDARDKYWWIVIGKEIEGEGSRCRNAAFKWDSGYRFLILRPSTRSGLSALCSSATANTIWTISCPIDRVFLVPLLIQREHGQCYAT